MRLPTVALCGAFLASTLAGCGGDPVSKAPANAKVGPPPGTSAKMIDPPPQNAAAEKAVRKAK